jgi:hypothetical protein
MGAAENENDAVAAGCELRQDNAGAGVAPVFLELCAQEVQDPAREWAARAAFPPRTVTATDLLSLPNRS